MPCVVAFSRGWLSTDGTFVYVLGAWCQGWALWSFLERSRGLLVEVVRIAPGKESC